VLKERNPAIANGFWTLISYPEDRLDCSLASITGDRERCRLPQ